MAKSPRKGYAKAGKHNKKRFSKANTTGGTPSTGGKMFQLNNQQLNNNIYKQRRFSILSSSSSSDLEDADSGAEKTFQYQPREDAIRDDSDSSLTAVSDTIPDRRATGSKTVGKRAKKSVNAIKNLTKKSNSKKSTLNKTAIDGPATSNFARKRTPKMDWDAESESEDEDSDDEFGEDGMVDGTGIAAFGELYAQDSAESSDSDSSNSTDTNKQSGVRIEEENYSSSDDSDVDFLKLQAEQKAHTIKAARAMKGISKFQRNELARKQREFERDHSFEEIRRLRAQNSDEDNGDSVLESDSDLELTPIVDVKRKRATKDRSNSSSLPKFGRRKSEAVLPDDINFTFEFGDERDLANPQSQQESSNGISPEEDIGEEVKLDLPTDNTNAGTGFNFDFDFDSQLIQVPKFKEEELNSDEDYEIDDNELLATLQADNDAQDEFLDHTPNNSHRNSLSSIGDEDEFLKEEERFLVNEFENNGFDGDNDFDDNGLGGAIEDEEEDDEESELSSNSLLDSFNNMNDESQVIQYESSLGDSGAEEDEDDYEDFIDFNVPLFEDEDEEDDDETSLQDIPGTAKYTQQTSAESRRKKKKSTSSRKSDEDDDSYLWNYFFSSDESDGSEVENFHENERISVEEMFKELEQPQKAPSRQLLQQQQEYQIARRMTVTNTNTNTNKRKEELIEEVAYDSGESTDVELDLPVSNKNNKYGSNSAKEVLSSKTADYRPPVLGTWVAVDSKPFGIIDGLSTRSLGNSNISSLSQKNAEPRSKGKKSISIPIYSGGNSSTPLNGFLAEDVALGLDELLNVSELDNDDENDVKIWRDFNIQQQKKVPLGAFRNKSNMNTSNMPHFYQPGKANETDYNKRRYSLTNAQAYGTTPEGSSPGGQNKRGSVRKPSISRRVSYSATPTAHAELSAAGALTASSPSIASNGFPSKSKRRRASIVEAVAEGYRPTKSGLFSEHALSNVEEFLGDDNDLMALIKGL